MFLGDASGARPRAFGTLSPSREPARQATDGRWFDFPAISAPWQVVLKITGASWSGRPGRLPTSAPHGSVHAQLRHTALRATNSPATSRPRPCIAIRRRPVEMVTGLGVPGIYPSGGLMARRLLPSAGSLGSVPPLPGTIRRSDSPPPLPPHFVAFAWRYPGRIRGSLPWPPDAPATGLELVTRCSRRDLPRRWRGLPGSWGTSVNVPCSPTPAGPRRQAIAAPRRGLPSFATTSAPATDDDFGAPSHGPFTRCLRFAAPVTRTPTKASPLPPVKDPAHADGWLEQDAPRAHASRRARALWCHSILHHNHPRAPRNEGGSDASLQARRAGSRRSLRHFGSSPTSSDVWASSAAIMAFSWSPISSASTAESEDRARAGSPRRTASSAR